MRVRSILLMLRGFEQGATLKSVAKATGVSDPTVARYYRIFKAEGFKPGWNSRPEFYPGPDLIGNPVNVKVEDLATTKAGAHIRAAPAPRQKGQG